MVMNTSRVTRVQVAAESLQEWLRYPWGIRRDSRATYCHGPVAPVTDTTVAKNFKRRRALMDEGSVTQRCIEAVRSACYRLGSQLTHKCLRLLASHEINLREFQSIAMDVTYVD